MLSSPRERCGHDAVDLIAEILWNTNPQHPYRRNDYKTVFEIPAFKYWLREHPRPDFPRYWNRTKEESAVCIQKTVRGWMARRDPEIQKIRQFWKVRKGAEPPYNDPALAHGSDLRPFAEKYEDFIRQREEMERQQEPLFFGRKLSLEIIDKVVEISEGKRLSQNDKRKSKGEDEVLSRAQV